MSKDKKVYGDSDNGEQENAINAGPNVQAIVDSGMTPEEFARKHPNVPIRDETTRPIDPRYDAVEEDTERKTTDKVREIQEEESENPSSRDEIHPKGPDAVVVSSPSSTESPSKPSAEPSLAKTDESKVPNHPSTEKAAKSSDTKK